MKIHKNKQQSVARMERGRELLFSLKILINVLFALLIFQIFMILPRPGDQDLETHGLRTIFSSNSNELMIIVIGMILIATYWLQLNKQLGNLVRSTMLHATVCFCQMVSLMLYLYFVRLDLEIEGVSMVLQMQSAFLALAGFLGVFNWSYARRHELTSDQISQQEERQMLFGFLPEPMAALIALPFATVSPTAWSLSFLIVIPLSILGNKLGRKS